MREKLIRFMIGRNGNDELNRFLLTLNLILILLAVLLRKSMGRFLVLLALLILICIYFRMFSRDRIRRSEENLRFLRLRDRLFCTARIEKERWVQRNDFKFFVCPACKATLRVPKGRGKIKIVCKKCGNSFMGKS